MAAPKATNEADMDKDEAKQLKAAQKDEAKTAKAVAKDQDDMDARAVMRTSYSEPGRGGRYSGEYEYDRKP